MPKRTDIHKILIIGSGPIIISQACEFDYSGSQGCKALKEEGFEVVLINSNPATIMTDPEIASRTYIEPITPEIICKIIEKERPDALLPTLGGQTALNMAVAVEKTGILDKYNVKLIGANIESIKKAEDRQLFKEAIKKIGLNLPKSEIAYNINEAREAIKEIGFPLIIRPSFTLGGTGGGIVYNQEEFEEIASRGLAESMIHEILIEQFLLGWKEYELEVMRDLKDNVIIICSIENIDPMGIHTGDSITVAPAQTLSDKEYQQMRDASIKIIREIGIETGGSNIQFAVNPDNGEMVVIEMNPRVSRSSALASKVTGFPIAKIAVKLSVGYTLDEIPNDITRETPASFEPVLDYCVVKIPRFTFDKFPQTKAVLGISMKSVGEAMSIGRNFREALQKGLRSLEVKAMGLDNRYKKKESQEFLDEIKEKLRIPCPERLFFIKYALESGITAKEVNQLTKIDPWFIDNIEQIIEIEREIKNYNKLIPSELLKRAKRAGFSDVQISELADIKEDYVRQLRKKHKIEPVYRLVDTCAAEFEAKTPYYYSTYTDYEDEVNRSENKKVVILGGGPNRIGQGIEFDYCCVHCSFALKELGYETIMVNSNPETVSTDYDTSDRLYFEPLTKEDVLNIIDKEKPLGVIVQFGGQTPLNLAVPLQKAGVNILGTSPDSIDCAEDRKRFSRLLSKLNIKQPKSGTAFSFKEAKKIAKRIGYPIIVRPSYVLGGRAMKIVYDETTLEEFMKEAAEISPEHSVLIDKFLEDAVEIDVDAVSDGKDCIVCGIMEHIEEAGIHSGDSSCVIPPFSLGKSVIEEIKKHTFDLARELKVVGLMNIQYVIKNDVIYVLEVNPRASRTVPFVSKATGIAWAKVAAKVILGKKLKDLEIARDKEIKHVAVKAPVFPFNRFPNEDPVLGPEMKSTGEVMGIDREFGLSFAKAQIAAGNVLPLKGNVFVSVVDKDKRSVVFIVKKLVDLGFKIYATNGTCQILKNNGIEVNPVLKIFEGRPNIMDLLKNGEIHLIINTPSGKWSRSDQLLIRGFAVVRNIPLITTISGAQAAVNGIEALIKHSVDVRPLQDYYKDMA